MICNNIKDFKPFSPYFCKTENYLCLICGLVFIPTRSKFLQKYYKEGGYFKKSPNIAYKNLFFSKSLLTKISRDRIKNSLSLLSINLKSKRVLDVGCGYGEIGYVLRKDYDSKVLGIEASLETARFGSKIFSLPIQPKLLEDFKTKDKFDVIWCSHVLEHASDIDIFLKKIKSLLSKYGLIYFEMPNILMPTGGFDLNMFLYSEHLQTFSAYNFYLLLKKHKINVIAYSDLGFLKFWCGISAHRVIPRRISAQEILKFLKKYKKEYNMLDSLIVYFQKLLYVLKLLIYKVYDVLI